jgi:two-component system chemotaxis sensor kinase CheA
MISLREASACHVYHHSLGLDRGERGDKMDDLISEFVIESNENLDRLDSELVKLELDPSSEDLLSSIFRTIHTIKGSCGFLGFAKLEKVAHAGESLLSLLRDDKISLTAELTSGLLSMVDAIRAILGEIQSTGNDGHLDYPDLRANLNRLQQFPQGTENKVPSDLQPVDSSKKGRMPARKENDTTTKRGELSPPKEKTDGISPMREESTDSPTAQGASESKFGPVGGNIGVMLVERGLMNADALARARRDQLEGDPRRIGEILVSMGSVTQRDLQATLQIQDELRSRGAGAETIRVDVHVLDKLMNLVGELVLTRNQITQYSAGHSDATLSSSTQKLNLLTSELQEEVMKTRMQPISNLFDKFPRVVRDVAMGCGKQVQIEMEGKETELDKSLLEAIKDPLTHIVRNSMDHGIEMPDQRVASGKRPEGHLKLRACHEGGQVVIEISDDGAGIDTARVKSRALERGLITPQQAAHMSERELLNLIFLPGFSTAEKVTSLSGRGVGMDVVKTNIDKVNGSVDLQSNAGKGTTLKIKIPLTVAIVRAVIVRSAGKRFAIPQVSIQELVRLDGDRVRKDIELVHGVPVYRKRGKLLPVIYLSQELGLATDARSECEKNEAINIVVLQADDQLFGLVVDEINDSEEIVVKPLGKQLKGIKVFAGATIMGDGRVSLILDVVGLAQSASILSGVRDRALAEKADEVLEKEIEKHTFLLFAGPDDSRMALPLAIVARLEEFPVSQVEKSGNEWVIQYRGKILPLLRLVRVLEERRVRVRQALGLAEHASPLQVLVCNDEGEAIGIVVERILDIVEDRADVKSPATRAGVLYSVVINERVTELLDIPAIKRFSLENRGLQFEHAETSN